MGDFFDSGIVDGQSLSSNQNESWIKSTEENYKTAASFYQQKRDSFLQSLNILRQKGIEKINEELSQIFENVWQEGVLKALAVGVNNFSEGAEMAKNISKQYNFNFNYEKLLQMYIGSKGSKALMGFEYEKIVAQLLSDYFYSTEKQAGTVAKSQANSLISVIPDKFSKSASATTSSSGAFIRADISNISFEKGSDNVTRIAGTGIAAELQQFIDIENTKYEGDIPLELLPYLEAGGVGPLAGFSVKKMTSLSGTKFSQSANIAGVIQSGLTATLPTGQRRMWQQDWAEAYSNWCLSKVLFNILGPIDIALVSGNSFHWLCDFLGTNRFRMPVQQDGEPLRPNNYAFRKTANFGGINAKGKILKRKDEVGKIFIKGGTFVT